MTPWHNKISVLILIVALFAGSTGVIGSAEAAGFKWYNPVTWMEGDDDRETVRKREEARRKAEQKRKKEEERIRAQEEKAARKKAEKERKKAEKEGEREKKKALDKATAKGDQLGVLIQTQRGNITIALFEDEAPVTVRNFKRLVENKFYDNPNMIFHRVVPGFVVQTGDPTGTGYGGSKDTIPLEVDNKLSHDGKGVVAMARGARPDSATSQFYITLTPQKQLDGKYAIFGQVVSGLDVLERIQKGDKVYGVKLIDVSGVVRDNTASDEPGMFKKFFSHPF